jgi:hypothetical protein
MAVQKCKSSPKKARQTILLLLTDRYSFIVVDLHHLLLAPASETRFEATWPRRVARYQRSRSRRDRKRDQPQLTTINAKAGPRASLKEDHRMGRNYLTGRDGDRINAVLAAAGGKKLVTALVQKKKLRMVNR